MFKLRISDLFEEPHALAVRRPQYEYSIRGLATQTPQRLKYSAQEFSDTSRIPLFMALDSPAPFRRDVCTSRLSNQLR